MVTMSSPNKRQQITRIAIEIPYENETKGADEG
jgi:hypothetical protein